MTARLLPGDPRFVNDNEVDICRRLVKGLPDGSVLLANQRISYQGGQDVEADLVAMVPGSGIVVIEVKGGRLWRDEMSWWQPTPQGPREVRPFQQAMRAKRALIDYVNSDPRWSGGRVRWSHHVVLPQTTLSADFATPEAPRWMVSGEADLPDLVQQLLDNVEVHVGRDSAVPTRDQVQLLAEILAGRALPQRDVLAQALANEQQTTRLTEEQATLLNVTRLIPRVEVRGGAGSGKTHLAIEHARRLADGRLTGTRQRVAVVCYSYGLAGYLRRTLLTGSHAKQPRFVGAFEALANKWGIDTAGATRDRSDFWERELPELMAERARALPPEQRFDAIIVDEAQDFADHWWTPLLLALADPDEGRLGLYSDEHQRVFNRFGAPPVQVVPLVLDHNLRNTRQIHAAFEPLAPVGMSARGGDGPEVDFISCATEQALEVADDAVEALLEEGWQPKDVALLTVGTRHPVQEERQASMGYSGYFDSYWDDSDVFYGHVLGFKGMERRAVVLCINTHGHSDRAAERLYVGLSRATERLVVVGDLDVVQRMGGAQVRDRLAKCVVAS